MRKRAALITFSALLLTTGFARADFSLPTSISNPPGSPIIVDGCTAARGDSPGGYLNDYYIRGNASFTNGRNSPATEVDIMIHYQGAYGDHDALLIKHGSFAPGVRIDPKRRTWVAMLQPYTTNIDVDGSTEIDIWGTVSAICEPIAARFEDGAEWNILNGTPRAQATAAPQPRNAAAPKVAPAPKCTYNEQRKEYECSRSYARRRRVLRF